MRLSGQVALVTGGASGIGYSIARGFAEEGSKVVIADLDPAISQSVARKIAPKTRGQILGVGMDVTNEASVEDAVGRVIDEFGKISILVSNAGIQFISRLDELAYSNWRSVLAVHLDGAFLTTRECLKHMYANGTGGSIIYLGSVHSKTASVLKGPYVTAKHGLIGLCRVVAKEGAPYGVRSNIICPGFVRTPLVEQQIPEQTKLLKGTEEEVTHGMVANTVDAQFTTLEEVAEAAVFIASQRTLALTGQSLIVSHGWVME